MTLSQILDRVRQFEVPHVTVTGGELSPRLKRGHSWGR